MDNPHKGSSLDSFLEEEGVLDAFETTAIKEVVAWQLSQEMKRLHISKKRLAEQMKTSRTQVDRVLDPQNGNITIETLQKAAAVLGKRVQFSLI